MKYIILMLVSALLSPMIAHAEYGSKVGSYQHGKYSFNVNAIPAWQDEQYDKIGMPRDTRQLMRVLNQLECGHVDGFCLGFNAVDAGPFQINRIHGEDYRYSVRLVRQGLAQTEEAKKSGNWSGVIATRNELFLFQAQWTWDRMKRLAKQFENRTNYSTQSRERQVWLQALWHNGNTKITNGREFRFWYADKAVKHYRILVGADKMVATVKINPVKTVKLNPPLPVPEPIPEEIQDFEEDIPVFPELLVSEITIAPPAMGDFYFPEL